MRQVVSIILAAGLLAACSVASETVPTPLASAKRAPPTTVPSATTSGPAVVPAVTASPIPSR